METKDQNILDKFKTIRNKVRDETRNIIREEQRDIGISSKNNPKKFWNYVKSKTKNTTCIGDIKYLNENNEQCIAKTNEEKSEAFCNYFSSVFTRESSDTFESLKCEIEAEDMADISFKIENIKMKLKHLNVNKSPGPDNIHPRILSEASEILALPLKILFETSFKKQELPLDWKSANISTIFKKGSKLDISNYRPISLTCICCKIMESIIRDEIFSFLMENNLLSQTQFGFIKGRSTVLQLLKVLDEWTESLQSGGQIDVIYTDFEKAFDKVPHKRLLSKLKSYKINGNIIEWIESFLLSRKQRVKINGVFSNWQNVLSGIPQGSVLGPLLFIIYINDLVEVCSQGSRLFLYADDAKIFKHISNDFDKVDLQSDLDSVKQWSDTWLLKLNEKKCKVISYGKEPLDKTEYFINSGIEQYQLEKLEFINDLGIIFDTDLKFNIHINEKVKKAYSILGVINRNFKYMSKQTFILIYKSMVRSHLEYGNCVWSPTRIMDIEKLERVQKRATKMIFFDKQIGYEERLKSLNLPTLKYRRARGDMIETYKIITEKYESKSANVVFIMNKNTFTRGNRFKLFPSNNYNKIRDNFFTNRVINVWNSLPDNVVCAKTTNAFKNLLDKFWSNQQFKFNWRAEVSGTGSRS